MQIHFSAYNNIVAFDTRRIKSLIAIWFGCSLMFCQSAFSQKYGSEGDSNRLYFLNLQYTQSWVRSDTSTYNHLLWAEDFVHQNSADGILYPKEALSSLFGKPRFEKLEYFYPENVTIQFITSEAAMVFARTRLRWAGQPTEAFSQYNDVYIKREGRWICVSANVTSLSKPGDARAVFTKLPEPTRFISYHEGKEADKNVLKELNSRITEALLRSKSELAENILADDFTLLASNGLLYKKREVLEQIRNTAKSNSTDTYSIENLSIRFVAHNVAMIHAAFVTRFKDGTIAGTQCNNIYVKREDRWVCVSANNTPIKN